MRNIIPVILILLIFASEAQAQHQSKMDSLVKSIPKTSNPRDKIDLYNQIASGYERTDSLKTAKYAQLAIALAKEINYPEGISEAYENLGTSAKATGHYPEAKTFYQKALDEAPEHGLTQIANAQNGLASIYRREGNYPAALEYYLNNLELYTKANNKRGLAFTYGNMGLIYDAQEDYTKSLELRKKTLKFVIEINDSVEIARSYHNLGATYSDNEMLDSALFCYNKSLEIRQLLRDEYGVAKSSVNIASAYFLLEEPQHEQAIKFLLEAEETFQKINNKYWLVHTQSMLAKGYQETDQLNLAIDYGERAFRLAEDMEDLNEIETSSSILHSIYAESGDYKRAYKYLLIYKETSNKILNEKNTEELTELAMQHEFDKEKALIAAENEKKTANQRLALLAALAGLLLVSVLAIFIRKGQKRLQELDKMKSRFFTNISHEFRTPLTIISGMADQIRDKPDQFANMGSEMIKRNTMGLLRLVNQILDLRKLESGALQLDLIQGDIVPFLQYVFESFESYAENRNIELHFTSSLPELLMDYDPDKVQQIFSNLVSNAIRYSEAEAEVFFQVDQIQKKGFLLVSVRDTGIGIPADKLPRIFDRFFQADDSSTRRGEGSGIGLTFTRELVHAMGGSISVESEQGKGSTFRVKLPVRNEAPLEGSDKTIQPTMAAEFVPLLKTEGSVDVQQLLENGEQPRLLIVEDNPDIVRYLISCLGDTYQIEVAVDGQEGIEKAIEQVPDIILSDVMMPRKDGFELCRTLKTDERTSHIPIVLLTAKVDQDSRISGLQRGADAYLAKPFNQTELMIRLRKLLEIRKALQARYSKLDALSPSEDVAIQVEDAFILKVKEIVLSRLMDTDFKVDDLYREMGLSRTPFFNKIKALTGKPVSHFIRSIRLEKAKELLRETELQVGEISYETGFSNPSYFNRVFIQQVGKSPGAFRKEK